MNKNYSIKLGIKLDERALSNINSELNNKLKDKNIKISIDAKNLTQIKDLLNNIYLELGRIEKKNGFGSATKGVKQLNNELEKTTKHIKNQSFATGNWAYNWSKAMQSFLTYNTVTQFFNTVSNGIKDMIGQVKELDDSLTELKKVTDLEGNSLDKFVDRAYQAGEEVAKTGTEMVDAATSFAKAGYDEDIALDLGKVAAMYTNIADEEISTADAADFIIAQMKAFKLETDDTTKTLENAYHVIDAVNEVSNNFAVSSSDIASNLGKASAVMANAGNSLEQMIGLMTAGTEITRNASKVANGLKTITLRLQGMNDEGEKDLQLQAQMEGLFKKLGISVYDTNGELKNTYEILDTLAPVYGKLTNAEKAFVTETIAGKYQAQNAAAILSNWQTALDATSTALDSNGSATRENEAVLDSIQGHLQKLSSAWEQLSKTIFDSDLIKIVIDLGTALLKLASNNIVQGLGKIVALFVGLKVILPIIDSIKLKFALLTNSILKNTAALVMNSKATKSLSDSTKKSIINMLAEKGAIDKKTGSLRTDTLEKIKAKLASEGLSKAEQTEILRSITLTATHKAAAKAAFTLKGAFKGLTAAMAANPIGLILVAVTGLVTGLNWLSDSAERAKEKYETLNQEFEEASSKAKETDEKIEETKKRIEELKNKGKLTFTDKEEIDKLEKANLKLETQLELYKEIANEKGKAAKKAANEAYDKEYNSMWSQKKLTNKGELKDRKWYDLSVATGSVKEYGNDTDVITHAVNLYDNLNEKRKEGIKLSKEEKTQYENLGISLAKELDDLEKQIPNLTGKTKKEAQDLRDYIVHHMFPETYQKEKANKFFGIDADDKDAQKIKEQFKDIQKEMDELYKKGELTEKKIWELRGQGKDGEKDHWNKLDEYMRDNFMDNSAIIDYFNTIYEKSDETSKKVIDDYQKQAEARKEAGKASKWDEKFTGDSDDIKEYYDELIRLADGGKLSAESIEELDEKFNQLSSGDDRLKDIADILDYFSDDAQNVLTDYSSKLDEISQHYGYLTSAVDEYNDAGYLSSETLKNLMDNDLLQYLSFENGQLVANTSELYNKAEAERIAASQELAAAMASDVLNVATGNVSEASGLAQAAVAGLGNAATTAGNQAASATGQFISFAQAVDQANQALQGKKITGDIKNKISAVESAYKPYFAALSKPINIKPVSYSGSGGGSGSGGRGGSGGGKSSKSEKAWWEKAYDKLKDQFDNNQITINQYINGLNKILKKTKKGSEAWKKINKELQKAKLDKLKDDYDAGRISLNKYIKGLQKLQKAYKKGTEGWKNLAKEIKKAKLDKLKKQQDAIEDALSAVNHKLDKQKEKYEKAKEAAEKKYDKEIEKLEELQDKLDDDDDKYQRAQEAAADFLDKQREAIEKQRDAAESYYDSVIEAIEKMNEKQSEAVELAEAYEALMNAMSQKTKKVYKEGLGWVWTTDAEAIREAKKNYEDLLKNNTVKDIEEQRDKTVQSLEDQINTLQEYIDSWDKVLDKFENEKNRNFAQLLLGDNWEEMLDKLDPQVVEDFSNAYYDLQKNLEDTENQIEKLNEQRDIESERYDNLIEKLEEYQDRWDEVADEYQYNQDKLMANQVLGKNWESQILTERLEAVNKFAAAYKKIWDEVSKVENMSDDKASTYTPKSLPGFAQGGEVDYTGLAMLHGTPNKPEYVLNNTQMKNLLGNLTKPGFKSNFKSSGNSSINNYNFGNIELPNVTNAHQFANELQSLLNITKNQ